MEEREMYVLERKEPFILQYISENESYPVYTFRWKEIAIAENKEDLETIKPKDNPSFQYRIERIQVDWLNRKNIEMYKRITE